MKKLLLGFVLSFSISGFARDLTTEQKNLEFNQLVGYIYSSYGPLEYKQRVQNINVKEITARYRAAVENSKSDVEYYELIQKYIAEFKDSHLAARMPTKKRATLPFQVDLIEGRVLVSDIDVKALPADKFPVKRGDEVVSFDGRPPMDTIKELMAFRGDGYSKTTLRIVTMYLTLRSGAVFKLPSGKVTVQIKSRETQAVASYELDWNVTGTDWESTVAFKNAAFSLDDLSIFPMLQRDFGPNIERSYMCNGGSRIKRPENATIISESDFVAYYYPTAKGNVGYLRIPHYMPSMFSKITEEETAFRQYEYAVSELEKNTVGLIIDQDHNCGGSVSFLERLVTLFIMNPVEPTGFRLLANKEFLISMENWLAQLNPLTIEYKQVESLLGLIKKTRDAGDYLTPMTSLTLEKYLYPNKVRYTKPIIMLIDELSGSGGDAFPSIMQGIGRVQLLGTRTMGAGGHVTEMAPLSFSRINIHMTRSLFYRPDGVEVENNGAVPNIPYSITEQDFVGEYVPYREFYTKKLLELL